jgi:hypothetical protein
MNGFAVSQIATPAAWLIGSAWVTSIHGWQLGLGFLFVSWFLYMILIAIEHFLWMEKTRLSEQ